MEMGSFRDYIAHHEGYRLRRKKRIGSVVRMNRALIFMDFLIVRISL